MQVFRGLEEWGRGVAIGALARVIPTPQTSAEQAGQILSQSSSPKILFVGIYQHMGQFLCATPLIRALKTAWPKASLHFLGNPVNAAAARGNPHLDQVWVWKKSAVAEWPGQLRALRKEHFDLALLLTTERPSATGVFLARAMGARWVAGYVPSVLGAWAQEVSALCHLRIPYGDQTNEVEKFLGFARAFGVPPQGLRPEFCPSAADQAAADSFVAAQNWPASAPKIGLFIGGKAERSDRLWPVAHFAQVADALKKVGISVIAVSPPPPIQAASDTFQSEEHLRLDAFRRTLSWSCPVFQEASLGRVGAFLRKLDLLVCPDGGILHVAASVGTPTLGLFFSTDPAVWRHEMPQAFLDGRGKPSSQMSPETVTAEVIRFLGVSAARS